MLLLAFESSARPASVALFKDGQLLSQYFSCTDLTHSTTLLPMAEAMLKHVGVSFKDIDVYAVAHGPGSFTGIRIGISTVKGLAWAGEKPCIGVSTLEAMAWNGVAVGGYICPVMDARRSQVYNGLFEIRDGRPVRIRQDKPIALSELKEEVDALKAPVFLVGDGAKLTADYFEANGTPYVMAPENLLWQNAWGVGKAAEGKEPGHVDMLLPAYLRLSQAERERLERLEREGKNG